MRAIEFLPAHLNVNWLRPESALWDAIASATVSQVEMRRPSLDLGAGNGLWSFITAGGEFSAEYDWYRNTVSAGSWDARDIYDTYVAPILKEWIAVRPAYTVDWALDVKPNLLRQAQGLGFYEGIVVADAHSRLPFDDAAFRTVFSNILYWLASPERSLQEIRRVLERGGRCLLCLPDHRFREYCVSYRWQELSSPLLKNLNRGRSESMRWTTSYGELKQMAINAGFRIVTHSYYLSPMTLRVWDIGLRSLSPVLVRMLGDLSPAQRAQFKADWIAAVRPFAEELCLLDEKDRDQGGFHFVCLEKV